MKYSIVLNTHIPRCDRPWAYEALFHCYVPLFDKIKNYPVTMGFSPQLIYEFTDPKFAEKCKTFYKDMMDRSSQIEVPHLKKYYTDFYTEQMNKLEDVNFDTQKLWRENKWEILAYPSTHCVLPLVTEKLIRFFLDEGERVIKEYFGVEKFSGIWLPEMAFEDGPNNLKQILAERYEYIFGNWKTVQGVGSYNKLYKDINTGLKLVIRNDNSQSSIWGDKCKIAGFTDFRETHNSDNNKNKIYRIGGGTYYPEDTEIWLERAVHHSCGMLDEEVGDHCSLMFDTEYFGHHWWEGREFLPRLTSLLKKHLIHTNEVLKLFQPREINISGKTWTWGSTGDERGNSNLDTWVNSKVHIMLQYYREKMIEIDKWSDAVMKEKLQELNMFFSSDWLFIVSGDVKDIYEGESVEISTIK